MSLPRAQKSFHCLVTCDAAPWAWWAHPLPSTASVEGCLLPCPCQGTQRSEALLQDSQLTQAPECFLNSIIIISCTFFFPKYNFRRTPETDQSRTSLDLTGRGPKTHKNFPSCHDLASSSFPEASERNAQKPLSDTYSKPLLWAHICAFLPFYSQLNPQKVNEANAAMPGLTEPSETKHAL